MSTQTRRDEIAHRLGEDSGRLRELKTSIVDKLVRDGVLVRVHIGRWRATHRLTAEDLGLDPEIAKSLLQQVTLGWKLLLPRPILRDLNGLESRGRENLARHSLDTLLGPFMPASAFPEFKAAHEALEAAYRELRDNIAEHLDEIRSQVATTFATAAAELYPTVVPHVQVDRDAFVADYVARAMALYPSAEQIHNSFYFEYTVTYVPLSRELLAEEARRADIVRNQQLREELTRHLVRRKREEIDGFVTDVVRHLRAMVYEAVTSALASLRKGTTLSPRTMNRLRTLIDRVRLLDVYGDAEIEARLRQLEAALGRSTVRAEHVPNARLEQALIDLQQATRDAVSDAFSVDPLLARFHAVDFDVSAGAPEAEQIALGGMRT